MELLIVHIPNTTLWMSGMIALWLSLNQQLVTEVFLSVQKVDNMTKIYIHASFLCFLKAKDGSIHAVMHCCNAA